LRNPPRQASYQGGRTKPLKYSIKHPILLEMILGHPIIPKYLSVIVKSKVGPKSKTIWILTFVLTSLIQPLQPIQYLLDVLPKKSPQKNIFITKYFVSWTKTFLILLKLHILLLFILLSTYALIMFKVSCPAWNFRSMTLSPKLLTPTILFQCLPAIMFTLFINIFLLYTKA